MNNGSLKVLTQLIEDSGKNRRLKELLKDPEAEKEKGWFMAVPPCFNDSLDIEKNSGASKSGWTQGRWFRFKVGETLYDTPAGYEVWSEALKQIGLAVQIETASSVSTSENGIWFPGSVTIALLTPNQGKNELVKRGNHMMTQIEFVRFLISGPDDDLNAKLKALERDD